MDGVTLCYSDVDRSRVRVSDIRDVLALMR